jgi:hypothetical protein
MSTGAEVDGVLVQWGERLFYPGNRIVRSGSTPRLSGGVGHRAAAIRRHIQATVRRAPQVMVKVTGGGRGMRAIAAHFRYISRNGHLEIEDDRGVTRDGKEALHDLEEQWQHGGSFIDETSHRREAFNLMLSMPDGTDPLIVQRAAREFARDELGDHRYVMALHDDQANPHVHISVRAESRHGERLNPRKADLQRWRETFAEKLRGWGIDAEATRQAARGQIRSYPPIWRVKAKEEGRLKTDWAIERSGAGLSKPSPREASMGSDHRHPGPIGQCRGPGSVRASRPLRSQYAVCSPRRSKARQGRGAGTGPGSSRYAACRYETSRRPGYRAVARRLNECGHVDRRDRTFRP